MGKKKKGNRKLIVLGRFSLTRNEFILLIVAVLSIMGGMITKWGDSIINLAWGTPDPKPAFGIEKGFINKQLPIIIVAKNDSSKCKDPLDVKWDDIDLNQAAIPHPDPEVYEWNFSVKDMDLSDKYKCDGVHKIEIGMNGYFDSPKKIEFFSEPPVVEASLNSEKNNPKNKILTGKTASMLQNPEEKIKVDVMIHSDGKSISHPLHVEKKIDPEGRIYFDFDTSFFDIPDIAPENPRYQAPFFAFLVTDQAGNRYYHSMSYSQFIAPGPQKFGVNRIADIKVDKHREIDKNTMLVSFKVRPIESSKLDYKGKKVLDLKVSAHTLNFASLEWTSLPKEIKAENTATYIYRDKKVLGIAFGDSYLDKDVPIGKDVTYEIVQPDKNGTFYKSDQKTVKIDATANLNILTHVPEKLEIDNTSKLQSIPKSFCVTEDNLFLIPDEKEGTIKIFGRNENHLKFIAALGRNGNGNGKFIRPKYCFYSKKKAKLGVIDYGTRRVYILDRTGKLDFVLMRDFSCNNLGYDMEFDEFGAQVIISGYITDEEKKPFDLYGIDTISGKVNSYLLPSYQKYGLASNTEFKYEYIKKQTIPAVGIKAFIDVQGENLFFAWEGALRIIKINLRSKKKVFFGRSTQHYYKPDALKLALSYRKKDFKATWNDQKRMSYIRNVFATSRHVLLIYEVGGMQNNSSRFRIQMYTPDGELLGDMSIPGNPSSQMWFDKDEYALYSFLNEPNHGENRLSLLKYDIIKSQRGSK